MDKSIPLKIVLISIMLGITFGRIQQQRRNHAAEIKPKILPKTTYCSYNNKTYEAGDKFRPDPCTFCHCPRHNSRIQCAVQDCKYQGNCVRYRKARGECCGQCVEIGCKHTDGIVYKPGQVVVKNKCEQCQCPSGGGKVQCTQVRCPPVICVDPVKEEGDCCERCPNGPSCWLGNRVISANKGRMYRKNRCAICQCPRYPLPFWMRGKKIQAVCSNICA